MDTSKTRWEAHPETTDRDNFATSIYSPGYDGVLVARCNQNGQHPEHVAMILKATEAKADGAALIEQGLSRIAELEALLSEWRDWYRASNRRVYDKDSLPGRTDVALTKSTS